jgi:lysozyme
MTTLDLVKKHEGFKPQVYCDRCGRGLLKTRVGWQCGCLAKGQTQGNLTVGVGTRVDGPGITELEASQVAIVRIQKIAVALEENETFAGLDEIRQAALCDMAYNLGVDGLLKFTDMWACLEKHDFPGAADAMLHSKWALQVPRRAADCAYIIRDGEWFPTTGGMPAVAG